MGVRTIIVFLLVVIAVTSLITFASPSNTPKLRKAEIPLVTPLHGANSQRGNTGNEVCNLHTLNGAWYINTTKNMVMTSQWNEIMEIKVGTGKLSIIEKMIKRILPENASDITQHNWNPDPLPRNGIVKLYHTNHLLLLGWASPDCKYINILLTVIPVGKPHKVEMKTITFSNTYLNIGTHNLTLKLLVIHETGSPIQIFSPTQIFSVER